MWPHDTHLPSFCLWRSYLVKLNALLEKKWGSHMETKHISSICMRRVFKCFAVQVCWESSWGTLATRPLSTVRKNKTYPEICLDSGCSRRHFKESHKSPSEIHWSKMWLYSTTDPKSDPSLVASDTAWATTKWILPSVSKFLRICYGFSLGFLWYHRLRYLRSKFYGTLALWYHRLTTIWSRVYGTLALWYHRSRI